MIGIAREDEVDPVAWQAGSFGGGKDQFEVGRDAASPGFLLSYKLETLFLDVDRIDLSRWSGSLGQQEGKISTACAEIGYSGTGLDVQGLHDSVRLLPLVASRIIHAAIDGLCAGVRGQAQRKDREAGDERHSATPRMDLKRRLDRF
jgi:hypothetical protein